MPILPVVLLAIWFAFFRPYEYTDEEVAIMKEYAKVDSQVISTMLDDFEFNGEPFEMPCKVEDLPEGFTIDKIAPIAYLVDYDVQVLLDYDGETIAMCNKTPKADSVIFDFFIDANNENAELFTIRGIGIGSTEEELLTVFPDYDKPYEEKVEDGDTLRVFCYISENGYDEQIVFQTKNGIVDTILFSNY